MGRYLNKFGSNIDSNWLAKLKDIWATVANQICMEAE